MGSFIFHGVCGLALLQGVLALSYNGQNTNSPNSTSPTIPNQPSNATTSGTNETETETLPTFGDVVLIQGDMARTDQDFQDGLALDLFSPKTRTLTIQQNKSPLPGQYIAGTTGSEFISLLPYSYIIATNDTAHDLIAKIEIPYNTTSLSEQGIQVGNTYVGRLASDGKSWVVNDDMRNIHQMENNTRIIKMTSLDGEFMLLGRKSVDVAGIFVQYGLGETRTVNFTGGIGRQSAEFVDGLRVVAQCSMPVRMNAVLKSGVNPNSLPDNMESLNSYAWVVNTTEPRTNLSAEIRFPINQAMLAAARPNNASSTRLTIGKRALNATSAQFQPIPRYNQSMVGLEEDRIVVPGMTQLDGEYLILMEKPNNGGPAKRSRRSR